MGIPSSEQPVPALKFMPGSRQPLAMVQRLPPGSLQPFLIVQLIVSSPSGSVRVVGLFSAYAYRLRDRVGDVAKSEALTTKHEAVSAKS